jgi:hypothetical protein
MRGGPATTTRAPRHVTIPRSPPAAPSARAQALEFLYEFRKIPGDQPQDTHMFAMKKDAGDALFVPRLQSTVYHAPAFAREYAPIFASVSGRAFDSFAPTRAASRDVCLEECAATAVGARSALRMVGVRAGACYCFARSELEVGYDDPIGSPADANIDFQADPSDPFETYVVRFCEFVRPDTVRTLSLTRTLHTLPSTPLLPNGIIRIQFGRFCEVSSLGILES